MYLPILVISIIICSGSKQVQNFMKAHHVILGAASSAAVYKSLEIGSRLRKRGIIVHPVLTKNASRLISPRLFSSICGNEACVEMFQKNFSPSMPHIDLTQTADCILIAPATANILSKIAHGTGDDLLTTLCLARRCPLIVAPAMNPAMWQNYFTQHNAGLLKKGGVTIIEPVSGRVACQEEGIGRLADVDIIVEKVICHIPGIGCPGKGAGVFAGKKILITGGSSEEQLIRSGPLLITAPVKWPGRYVKNFYLPAQMLLMYTAGLPKQFCRIPAVSDLRQPVIYWIFVHTKCHYMMYLLWLLLRAIIISRMRQIIN